jgi:hypothetical protein
MGTVPCAPWQARLLAFQLYPCWQLQLYPREGAARSTQEPATAFRVLEQLCGWQALRSAGAGAKQQAQAFGCAAA